MTMIGRRWPRVSSFPMACTMLRAMRDRSRLERAVIRVSSPVTQYVIGENTMEQRITQRLTLFFYSVMGAVVIVLVIIYLSKTCNNW
jgi:hypothetical protein